MTKKRQLEISENEIDVVHILGQYADSGEKNIKSKFIKQTTKITIINERRNPKRTKGRLHKIRRIDKKRSGTSEQRISCGLCGTFVALKS